MFCVSISYTYFSLIFGFALYFGIGITWRKVKLEAQGWDVIPNKEFWQDLPYLIKVCKIIQQNTVYLHSNYHRMDVYLPLNQSNML